MMSREPALLGRRWQDSTLTRSSVGSMRGPVPRRNGVFSTYLRRARLSARPVPAREEVTLTRTARFRRTCRG